MHVIVQGREQIAANERQHHIIRHVPAGMDPFSVHAKLAEPAYQPNEQLSETATKILQQVHELLQAGHGNVRVMCPTKEIRDEVSRRLKAEDRIRIALEIGV